MLPAACPAHDAPPPPPPPAAGTVSGVQQSLCSLLEVAMFGLVTVLHRPEQFHWLLLASVVVVTIAAVVYLAYALRPDQRYQLIQQAAEGGP